MKHNHGSRTLVTVAESAIGESTVHPMISAGMIGGFREISVPTYSPMPQESPKLTSNLAQSLRVRSDVPGRDASRRRRWDPLSPPLAGAPTDRHAKHDDRRIIPFLGNIERCSSRGSSNFS